MFGIPLDGNLIMVYYRADLLQDFGLSPPTTWYCLVACVLSLSLSLETTSVCSVRVCVSGSMVAQCIALTCFKGETTYI